MHQLVYYDPLYMFSVYYRHETDTFCCITDKALCLAGGVLTEALKTAKYHRSMDNAIYDAGVRVNQLNVILNKVLNPK